MTVEQDASLPGGPDFTGSAGQSSARTTRPLWVALLAGPSIWFGHFMAIYLFAEVVCGGGSPGGGEGRGLLLGGVIGGTVVALATLAFAAVQTMSWERSAPDTDRVSLPLIGLGLDALFAVAILFTAVPIALLSC